MKHIALPFCSRYSTVTLHKTKTFLNILDNHPMKSFESGQSSLMNEHKTKDCAGLRPYSTSMFAPLSAPLKTAELHDHSPLLTMFTYYPFILRAGQKTIVSVHRLISGRVF